MFRDSFPVLKNELRLRASKAELPVLIFTAETQRRGVLKNCLCASVSLRLKKDQLRAASFFFTVSGRNSRISPGWQSSVSQIASRVEIENHL
jgi:hypothetical protein